MDFHFFPFTEQSPFQHESGADETVEDFETELAIFGK